MYKLKLGLGAGSASSTRMFASDVKVGSVLVRAGFSRAALPRNVASREHPSNDDSAAEEREHPSVLSTLRIWGLG